MNYSKRGKVSREIFLASENEVQLNSNIAR